jgi:hypothetical protein
LTAGDGGGRRGTAGDDGTRREDISSAIDASFRRENATFDAGVSSLDVAIELAAKSL